MFSNVKYEDGDRSINEAAQFYSAYNVHLLWDLIAVPDQNYIFQK